MGAGAGTAAALLERDEELAGLEALAAAAAEGRGAAVLVEGPAGIGKTSLVAAAGNAAARRGLDVLTARGGELERDLPWGIARTLLAPRATPEALHGAAALAAPVLLPEAVAGSAGGDPAAVLHGLYWLVASLAAEAPLLLAVDDLHWVDAASVRFLAYLARRVGELPVLVLLAGRPPADSHARALLEALGSDPALHRLELAPLSVAAVGALAGAAPAAAVHEATGGNPFLVRALCDELARGGDVAPDGLPELGGRAVRRAVAARMAGLGEDATALARAVAVLGGDVEPRHAYALAALGEDAGAAAEAALGRAGVLELRRPLEFVHPLVRAAVAQALLPPERARLHLRAARLLEADGAGPERLAPHLLAAGARADPWVVDVLRRAAARALRRGAPDAAVRVLRRALDEPPPAALRPAVLAELGRAEVRAALPDDAVTHLRAAQDATPDPVARARLAHDLAVGLIAPGRYEDAVRMLEEAIGWVRDEDPEVARRLEAELLCAARLDARTLPVSRAVAARLVPPPGATPGERALLATLAHQGVMEGRDASAVAAMARAALAGGLLGEQTGDSGLVMDAHFALAMAGAFDDAARACDAALAEVRRRGSVIGFARVSAIRAVLRHTQGALPAAESDARGVVAVASEPGYRVALMAHGPLVGALVDQGALDAADAALAAAGLTGELPDDFMLNFVLFERARLRLAQGRAAEGIAGLEVLGRREAKWRGQNPAVFPFRSLLALALPAAERERALALAEEEVVLARRFGAAGPVGRALRTAGLLQGGEDGLDRLREAAALLHDGPWRLEDARARVALGAALRRARRRAEAREPLHAGMELAHRCGARPLAAQAREELLATGARPRRIMRTGVDALTVSELRVARMAADGLGNREIAQALFVTVRTVEVHLTHCYQKLGIASREQLADALRSSRGA